MMKKALLPPASSATTSALALALFTLASLAPVSAADSYLDNETLYSNQDPETETRRSDHFRVCFGHYDRDGGMSEAMAQGNLQMFEGLWQRNIVELGLNGLGQSAILEKRDGNLYRANFHFLMTWNDGGGGGAYMSMDGNGYSYAMANPGYCRWDPPSGATPHEMGHVWEGQARGFNGSDSSGAWWECTANWFQLQLLNGYPNPGGLLWNSMYYPAHGRDYYDSWAIWEAARENPKYGPVYINNVWTNATPDQQVHEYIVDRMARLDSSGSPDKAGANRDLWGEMARKCVTWDYERQRWFASANSAEDGSDWYWYQRCRTPLVKLPGTNGWYRPERSHIPMQYGFNIIPLSAAPGATVTCLFQPQCDPVRGSDWRASLVAVSANGDARYSYFWNTGANSMTLSADETKLYLVVIATPRPMKTGEWNAYLLDNGLQFPYAVSFTNATPRNVVYPAYTGGHTHHPNGGGLVQNGATVAATAYVGPNAQVLGSAQVSGYARLEDYAVARGSAQIKDNAVLSGHAMVQDTAQVYGNAKVRDWARVFGNAKIYENARVIEHANVGDNNNVVSGCAVIKGTTYMYSPSTFSGSFIMDGDSANGGTADHGVHFGWQWGQNASIFTGLADNAYLYAQHTFEQTNALAVFAKDEFGINHGFLMNGCRTTIEPNRGGRVLLLDGASQYVELHNSLNDFRETAMMSWVKWTGTAANQRIWSMGDGTNKVMYLTPKDAGTGKLRLVISDGTTTQSLDGSAALGSAWTHVAVTFGTPAFNTTAGTWSATGTLYVNGAQVATLAGMPVPDSLNAPLMENANYLGRGNTTNYFQGYLDDFRVYSKTLTTAEVLAVFNTAAPPTATVKADTAAPTPNPATWLVPPQPLGDSAITMSATPGTDASGWVEYYFACTAGGGRDSGWVSFNKYTDLGLSPGTAYSYTVKLRDRNGNTTTASAAGSATTPVSTAGTAAFAYGPVGIANGQITMTAVKQTNASGKVEYKFDRAGNSSGWQASPTWTETGLGTGTAYDYTVTVRDGRGNVSEPVTAPARARDDAAPRLPMEMAHWTTLPYATIDNRVSMTAMDASDPSGVQYYFRSTDGRAPDSGWQNSPTYATPVMADGAYSFQYKLRDKSAQSNESSWSTTYTATVKPTTGYHPCTFAQLTTLPDDNLVSFIGTVTSVGSTNYVVRDSNGTGTITVKPSTVGQATDSTLASKTVTVSGHLYTLAGVRQVTYATVTALGSGTTFPISGTVTDTNGVPIDGARIYLSSTANAANKPAGIALTTTDGAYSQPMPNGTWYVAAGADGFNTSTDRVVTVSGAAVTNVNFALTPAAGPVIPDSVPLPYALNNTNLVWVTDAISFWYGQTNISHDGAASGQSHVIADGKQSTLSTSVTGPGTLSFWWKVSSETNADVLQFTTTGAEPACSAQISGEEGWTLQTFFLPAGAQTLQWTYSKNSSGSAGLDAAWVDEVSYSTGFTLPFILTQPASQSCLAGSPVTFSVGADGTPVLSYQWSRDGNPIPDATNALFTVPNAGPSEQGDYSVRVANSYGWIDSSNAALAVVLLAAVGDNSFGQLNIPIAAASPVAIAAGAWHSLALRSDGHVVAWGNNSYGQCSVPASLTNAVGIAAGGYHSLALRLDGRVLAWGANDVGQTNVAAGLANVIAVAAGTWHSLALRADGTVAAWGDNTYGQTTPPVGLGNVVAIAAGGNHSLALRADGTVTAWGENTDASGNFTGQSTAPWGLTNAVAIAAGEYHSLAVLNDGTLASWGDSSQGQCSTPAGLASAVAAAGGGSHTLALKADGTVDAWGSDWNSQCKVPAGLSSAVAVAAGNSHSLLLVGTPPASPLLLHPARSGSQFSLLTRTYAGKYYALEYKTALGDTNWTSLPPVYGNGALQFLLDRNAAAAQRFYRVRQW